MQNPLSELGLEICWLTDAYRNKRFRVYCGQRGGRRIARQLLSLGAASVIVAEAPANVCADCGGSSGIQRGCQEEWGFADDTSPANMINELPVFGAREPQWSRLEDKVLVQPVIRQLELPQPPTRVVRAEAEALQRAHEAVGASGGSVHAVSGVHGGGRGLRWIAPESTVTSQIAFLTAHGRLVRVQQFVDGIAASIHAVVTRDKVAILHPVEQLSVINPLAGTISFLGVATLWRPKSGAVAAMESAIARLAEYARTTLAYRGVLSVDGLCTDGAFLLTDINPRYSIGVDVQAASAGIPWFRLCDRALRQYGTERCEVADLIQVLRQRQRPRLRMTLDGTITTSPLPLEFTTTWRIGNHPHVVLRRAETGCRIVVDLTQRGLKDFAGLAFSPRARALFEPPSTHESLSLFGGLI